MGQTMTATPTNETDQLTESFAASYLRFCAAHLGELGRYIAADEVRFVRRIAHVFQGNTSRLGLSELAALGRRHGVPERCAGNRGSGPWIWGSRLSSIRTR